MTTAFLRPGIAVTTRTDPPPRTPPGDTSTWFVVGAAQKGPTTAPKLVSNMSEFQNFFGTRQSYSPLYDSLQTFFNEGGSRAYIIRVSGPASALASKALLDASSGTSLTVNAKNPGLWGNGLNVAVTQPAASTYQITVYNGTTQVDQSPYLTDQASAVNWSKNSDWVNVILGASSLIPAVLASTALTGGLDDVSGITDAQRQAALPLFTFDLGPGQVSMPGVTTSGPRTALIAHGRAFNRQAILDDTDSPSRSAIVTEAQGLQGDEYGAFFAPWVVIPGLVPNTPPRIVPPSAFVAGLMARSDASNSPNVPAAGGNGLARYAIDVSQPAWTDSDRDQLNTAGVNVIRNFNGAVQLYGNRTLANPNVDSSWIQLANQRVRENITDEANDIALSFVFDQLNATTIATFQGALIGMLMKYFTSGALYGPNPGDAFQVNVGPAVNTPTTLANGELHAVLSLRITGAAELVQIELVKIPISTTLN